MRSQVPNARQTENFQNTTRGYNKHTHHHTNHKTVFLDGGYACLAFIETKIIQNVFCYFICLSVHVETTGRALRTWAQPPTDCRASSVAVVACSVYWYRAKILCNRWMERLPWWFFHPANELEIFLPFSVCLPAPWFSGRGVSAAVVVVVQPEEEFVPRLSSQRRIPWGRQLTPFFRRVSGREFGGPGRGLQERPPLPWFHFLVLWSSFGMAFRWFTLSYIRGESTWKDRLGFHEDGMEALNEEFFRRKSSKSDPEATENWP